jgi:formyltetrahydrofolate synthetase
LELKCDFLVFNICFHMRQLVPLRRGGKGAAALGEAVAVACEKNAAAADFKLLYPKELSIKGKIEKIAKDLYRAADVSYSEQAEAKIKMFTVGLYKLEFSLPAA